MRIVALLLSLSTSTFAVAADPAEYIAQGNDLMRAGSYSEAAAAYEKAVKLLPNDAGVRANLGMAYHQAGRDPEAIRQFDWALRLDKNILPAMLMAAASWMRLGRPEKALRYLRTAAATDSQILDTDVMLAQALAATGKCGEAIEPFRRWALHARQDPRAWYGLARCYEELARESAAQVATLAPGSAYELALEADAKLRAGAHAAAFRLFRQVLNSEPHPNGLHFSVAEIYRSIGRADWAEAERRKEPAGACSGSKQACDYIEGRYESAAAFTETNPSAEGCYWRALALRGLADEAFSKAERISSAEAHAVRATRARTRGAYAESIREWTAAVELSAGNPEFERELATTLRMNEDYAGARPIVERLLKGSPESADLNYLLGHILLQLQEPAAAIPVLRRALQLAPGFLPVRSSLGLALLETGKDGEAIAHLRAALPLDRDGNLHFRLARALQKSGDSAGANAAFAKYRELQAGSRTEAAGGSDQIGPP